MNTKPGVVHELQIPRTVFIQLRHSASRCECLAGSCAKPVKVCAGLRPLQSHRLIKAQLLDRSITYSAMEALPASSPEWHSEDCFMGIGMSSQYW